MIILHGQIFSLFGFGLGITSCLVLRGALWRILRGFSFSPTKKGYQRFDVFSLFVLLVLFSLFVLLGVFSLFDLLGAASLFRFFLGHNIT